VTKMKYVDPNQDRALPWLDMSSNDFAMSRGGGGCDGDGSCGDGQSGSVGCGH